MLCKNMAVCTDQPRNVRGLFVLLCVSGILLVLLWTNNIKLKKADIKKDTRHKEYFLVRDNERQNTSATLHLANLELHGDLQFQNVVSSFGQSFQTWTNLSAPGTYRGCILFSDSKSKKINMVKGEDDNQSMTIVKCLNQCYEKVHMYAGLLGGNRCYCFNFTGPIGDSLHFVPTSQCSVPCSGETVYNCGGGNDFFSLYRTKVPDSRCSHISLKPNGSMPSIALASFPRSGNTWTRRLLEHATGIYTGSIYWEGERKHPFGSKIFLGGNIPYNAGSTLCTKIHVFNNQKIEEFRDGAILLIRNPYRAIVSEAFRQHKGVNSDGESKGINFIKSERWPHFVEQNAIQWKDTAISWCQNSKRLLVVYYEDLQKNPSKELKKMVKFLHQPLDITRIICATEEVPSSSSTGVSLGSYGLHGRSYLSLNPFTKSMCMQINRHVVAVKETLISYGHDPLPNYETPEVF